MTNKTLAIIDIGSFSLPYDFYYINELSKQGYQVDFYCSNTKFNNEFFDQIKLNDNITLKLYDISTSVNNKFSSMLEYLRFLKDLLINYKNYQYIHFMWLGVMVIDIFLFLLVKRKLIFTFHNHIPHNKIKPYLPYKIVYKLAFKVLFVSNFTENEFLKKYKIAIDNKYYTFNHGLLPFNITNEEEKSIKNVFEKTIVFWGNVKDYKGVDTLLSMVNDIRFNNWNIEVYGKWDKSLDNLKQKMKKTNISVYDKFLSTDELDILFKRDCIFILPYKDATQSGVLYTLLNYSKVFISTDMGDNGDFLRKYHLDKLLFNRENIDSIYSSIRFCKQNYSNIVNLLRDIRSKYEWSYTLKYIDRLYSDK